MPGTGTHERGLVFLLDTLQPFAAQVDTQQFSLSRGKSEIRLTNVIARFAPEKRERLWLCAHWDTRPRAERDPDSTKRNEPTGGANDGASGVAVLLELARLLHEHPPEVGIDLIFFDGEDFGPEGELDWYFLGSRYFARHLPPQRAELAILLDMVGDRDLAIYREQNSVRYAPEVVEKVWRKARELGVTTFRDSAKYSVEDDHLQLLWAGIPAIDVIDFDYPWWHTTGDTPDKCSAQSLAAIGRVLAAFIYSR